MKNFISVDPGTRTTGWAIFKEKNLFLFGKISSNKGNWLENTNHIVRCLDSIYNEHFTFGLKVLYLEFPEYWAGEQGWAARESGSIQKLSFLCGRIYERFLEYMKVQLITPSKWKGQLPKEVVQKRLKTIFSSIEKEEDHNVLDAIGVGYYCGVKGDKD
jgi:Holliday junction resolvasome RuvABC endonuclease subunit